MRDLFCLAIFLMISTTLVGCLRTRGEIDEFARRKQLQTNLSQLQSANAENESRWQALNEDLRNLTGEIEMLKREQDLSKDAYEKDVSKLLAEREALRLKIDRLEEELGTIKEASGKKKTSIKKNKPFAAGTTAFEKGEYSEAILNFDSYRQKYPSGRRYAAATLKMGQSFAALNKKQEARLFFDEIVTRFPQSPEAKKAKKEISKL